MCVWCLVDVSGHPSRCVSGGVVSNDVSQGLCAPPLVCRVVMSSCCSDVSSIVWRYPGHVLLVFCHLFVECRYNRILVHNLYMAERSRTCKYSTSAWPQDMLQGHVSSISGTLSVSRLYIELWCCSWFK